MLLCCNLCVLCLWCLSHYVHRTIYVESVDSRDDLMYHCSKSSELSASLAIVLNLTLTVVLPTWVCACFCVEGVNDINCSLYPSRELQRDWLMAYLESYKQSTGHEVTVTEAEVTQLYIQVCKFSLVSVCSYRLCWNVEICHYVVPQHFGRTLESDKSLSSYFLF